jgi:hypothetical protein
MLEDDPRENPGFHHSPARKMFTLGLAITIAVVIVVLAIWLAPTLCDQTFCSPG